MKKLYNNVNKFHIIRSSLTLIFVSLVACSSSTTVPDRSAGEEPLNEQRELIENNISDENKKTQMLKVVSVLETELHEFNVYYQQHKKQMESLHMSYVSKPEQFEAVKKEFIPKYKKYLATVISQRMELRNLATKEEWERDFQNNKDICATKRFSGELKC